MIRDNLFWRRIHFGVLVSAFAGCTSVGLTASANGPAGTNNNSTPTAPPRLAWYQTNLVGMEVGPTGAQFGSDPSDTNYAARFNGADIVRHCVEANGEYLVIWARDGEYAYYNSRLQPKCPGLGERDVLRETVAEARQYNLPVIAYCVLQYCGDTLRQHPDWRMRGPDGKPIDRVCYRSGYLDFMKQMLDEMLAYGIAGFHLDMVDQGFGLPYGCWCDTCQKQFQTQYGRPMPPGVTWDADWDRMLEFRYQSSAQFERALRDHVQSVNPQATVDFNYHGNPPFSWEVGQRPVQHATNGNFVTGETGVWGFSALGVGLNAEFYRAATPGLPVQVAIQRGVRMYHDQTTRPLNDIRWELLTLLAHGAFVTMVDKTAYDGWLDPVAYERIGLAFHEARAKREHFGHTPVQEVGLYFSSRTRDWYGRETPAKYFQSFQGAHKALVYEHITWGVLLDENVTLERLKNFSIVMLPNVAILSTNEIALFRRYVEEGGNLLLTGFTGLYDEMGQPRKESAVADLIGATLTGRLESLDNHIQFPADTNGDWSVFHRRIHTEWPFLVKGPAAQYQPTTATPVGELLKPHRTVRQRQGREGTDWPMSADVPVGPAILINGVGQGKVLTFAASPDFATASEHYIVEDRLLLHNAVRYLDAKPFVEITAPANVEVVVSHDAASRSLRVHLLGYNSPPATTPAEDRPHVLPGLIEDAPIFRVTITPRLTMKRARPWSSTTVVTNYGNSFEATVQDVHEVIEFGY